MSFKDVLKKSFLEGYISTQITVREAIIALLVTAVIACYIFYCYRLLTRRTFYSKNFNVSLVALALIVCGIIITIQSSVVVSLGMVGALSIVRFRTAVKEPMDLVFLFWSIAIGIICGVGLSGIAVVLSLVVSLAIFLFDQIPVAKAPQILVVSYDTLESADAAVTDIISKYSKHFVEKSRNITKGKTEVVVELRVSEGVAMTGELSRLEGIHGVSLLKHDGEVTF